MGVRAKRGGGGRGGGGGGAPCWRGAFPPLSAPWPPARPCVQGARQEPRREPRVREERPSAGLPRGVARVVCVSRGRGAHLCGRWMC
jgi:hypothetical protein